MIEKKLGKLSIIVFLLIQAACNSQRTGHEPPVTGVSDSATISQPAAEGYMYGIIPDSFNLEHGRIRPNTSLSDILLGRGVSSREIDIAARNYSSVFDVRQVRAGANYTLFCERNQEAKARYLVYEHNPVTSYIFSFLDSVSVSVYNREITRELKYSSGTIETSLWDAMTGKNLNPSLAVYLSEIFAWTIDFFSLQKNDSFKVIYEELFIGDRSIGIGKIYGAQFNRSGNVTVAIPFIQDGRESFFDIDGQSLRKAFLKAPLQFSRISSRFSSSRLHPILRIRRPHFGVDYAAPAGTPVHSIGDGRVTAARTEGGSGRMVRIQHNSVYATAYLHLSRYGKGIAAGAYVKQGDIIGYVGSSCLSTGPHLDFRFYKNGSPVDPLKVEAPPVEPVLAENMPRFEINKTVVTSLLNTIDMANTRNFIQL
ncbi:MAG: M23 family metallopeptidase [Bacteroidales bacterium]|jgi:murein DD-endopeptidase MepM/ murein hydrolase activator NlpD|nr:M23 family metallopeptidase [Bacteroidales bacterium]